jgi:hypothetical protein
MSAAVSVEDSTILQGHPTKTAAVHATSALRFKKLDADAEGSLCNAFGIDLPSSAKWPHTGPAGSNDRARAPARRPKKRRVVHDPG